MTGDRSRSILGWLREQPASPPSQVRVPDENVDVGASLTSPIVQNQHYFVVRIHEMFLTYSRKWFSTYDPMVFAVSEFRHGGEAQAVPFVVGPTLLERFGQEIPQGMVFADTRVAGLHPYNGGGLALSIVLYRLKRDDYARRLLSVVEQAAGALDQALALAPFLKVADAVLDGVEALTGLDDTKPVIGYRQDFAATPNDEFRPGYFALTADPIDPACLWVRDNRLFAGDTSASAQPVRDVDFVLCSAQARDARDDATDLPWFRPLWQRVVDEATVANDDAWANAKANMAALYRQMASSPDLTSVHARTLGADLREQMKALREDALANQALAGTLAVDPARAEAAAILDM